MRQMLTGSPWSARAVLAMGGVADGGWRMAEVIGVDAAPDPRRSRPQAGPFRTGLTQRRIPSVVNALMNVTLSPVCWLTGEPEPVKF
jgi:hypothetical protein